MRIRMTAVPFKVKILDSIFTMKRLTPERETEILRECSVQGQTDTLKYRIRCLEEGIEGWDFIEVVDPEGQVSKVGYDKSLISHVHADHRLLLFDALMGGGLDPFGDSSIPISVPSKDSRSGKAQTKT